MRTLALMTISILLAVGGGSAQAVVYCKAVGVPKGCVVRPAPVVVAPAPVVVRPAPVVVAPAPVVVHPAPVVRAAPGTPMNRGGPVNRVGRR